MTANGRTIELGSEPADESSVGGDCGDGRVRPDEGAAAGAPPDGTVTDLGGPGKDADGTGTDVEGGAESATTTETVVREVATDSDPRWAAGLALALAFCGGGIFLQNTALFLAATVGFGYAIYGYATRAPVFDLRLTRTVSVASPRPRSPVDVTLTVENEGDRPIPDVRVVDGVPTALEVCEGTPAHCTSLRAGESSSFSYTLAAYRGEHEFVGTEVIARNLSGSAVRRATVALDIDLDVGGRADGLALDGRTIPVGGRIPTDGGGEGVEFYATREYVRGDSTNRIDWKRYAATRDLRTTEFRVSESTTVVLLVETLERGGSRRDVVRSAGEPTAGELAAYAAERLGASYLDENLEVGVASFGERGGFLPPARGEVHRRRIERFLRAEDAGADGLPPGALRTSGRRLDWLREHAPDGAQFVVCTPLVDDDPISTIRRLGVGKRGVTVVSPDATADTAGGRIERLERAARLRALRRGGVRTVDWSPDEPLALAIERARRRWSA
jgi:uncharacterized protein (DUF58 family)